MLNAVVSLKICYCRLHVSCVLVLPDIAVKKCQPPLVSIPSYPEEQNLRSQASRGNAASAKIVRAIQAFS